MCFDDFFSEIWIWIFQMRLNNQHWSGSEMGLKNERILATCVELDSNPDLPLLYFLWRHRGRPRLHLPFWLLLIIIWIFHIMFPMREKSCLMILIIWFGTLIMNETSKKSIVIVANLVYGKSNLDVNWLRSTFFCRFKSIMIYFAVIWIDYDLLFCISKLIMIEFSVDINWLWSTLL